MTRVLHKAVGLEWNTGVLDRFEAGELTLVGLVAYRGRDSNGLEIRKPFNPAAFSPCLPKPYPALLLALLHVPNSEVGSSSFSGLPLNTEDTNDGAALRNGGRVSFGRMPLASARQDMMERLVLADSRKMRPRIMLRQPREKRKKAATSVKSSTWCERMLAEIKHWKIPRAPKPKEAPRTGKNRSKKAAGQPSSDIISMMTWKMIKSRLTMAQKTPAG